MRIKRPAAADVEDVVEPPKGLYWQDMRVGARYRTYARTVTEADLVGFTTLTGMTDSLFMDATRVGAMGERPVPGALTYAIIEGFIMQSLIRGTGMAMLGCTQEAIAPVRVGDTVHAVVAFDSVRPTSKPDRAIVDSTVSVLNQRGEMVLRYTSRRMIAGRPGAVG